MPSWGTICSLTTTGPMWLSCVRRQVSCRELWSTTLTCMTSNGPWSTPTCSTQRYSPLPAWTFIPRLLLYHSFAFIRMKLLLNVDGCVMAISVLWELLCSDWCGNILCSGCSGWWTSLALCRWRTLWSVWEPCFLLTSGRTSRSAFRWLPSITSSSPPRHSQSSSSPSRALRVRIHCVPPYLCIWSDLSR